MRPEDTPNKTHAINGPTPSSSRDSAIVVIGNGHSPDAFHYCKATWIRTHDQVGVINSCSIRESIAKSTHYSY